MVESIQNLKMRYPDEWLLLEILEENEIGHTTKAKLLAHSKAKDEIYQVMRKHEGRLQILFAGDIPKKGYTFAF